MTDHEELMTPLPKSGAASTRVQGAQPRAPSSNQARLGYQRQHSPQTLAEGLEEYYSANIGRVTRPNALPPESARLFRSHDMCHVIFGLNTAPADEALAGGLETARRLTSAPPVAAARGPRRTREEA